MKNFLIAYLFVLFLYPLSVSAQHPNVERYVDILEPGNPGGWGNSLKTWDMEYSMKAGDTVEFDVWLGDTGGGFWEGSYFATYDPSQLSMFDVSTSAAELGMPELLKWVWCGNLSVQHFVF